MRQSQTLFTECAEQTEAVGASLAKSLLENPALPPFVALYGDLGTGKTAFVRGFVSVVSPSSVVRSPTFALVNEYPASPRPVFHFDMYRITGEDDLYSIGFYDYLDRDGICMVEWSENIPFALPERFLRVSLEKNDPEKPDSRRITLEEIGEEIT